MMKSKWAQIGLIFAISIFIEIFIFNARSFELIGCKSPEHQISVQKSEMEETLVDNKNQLTFTIDGKENFPNDFRTVQIIFSNHLDTIITGNIYTKEKDFRWGHTKSLKIIPGVPHSQNVFIYPQTRVEQIVVTLEGIEIQDIDLVFNHPLSLQIQPFRLAGILLLLAFVWFFRPSSPIYGISLNLKRRKQKIALSILFVAFFGFLVFTDFSTYPEVKEAVHLGNKREAPFDNKQHYDLLTDALAAGSFALLEQPPSALEKLQNPYDTQEREKNVPDTVWDSVYYQGKYYSYFGVVPVLVLLLPYKLLTGEYLLLDFAVLFFAFAGCIGLLSCYYQIIRKYFQNLPAPLFFLGAVMLLGNCGIVWCARRCMVYETALSAAFCFTVCGLALIIHACDGEIKKGSLFFGCLFMALAIGCRPTAFFASLLNIPFVLMPLIEKKKKFKNLLSYALLCGIPYLLIASFLLFYNYARFGNPFEFGRNYQFSFIETKIYQNGLTLPSYLIGIVNFIFGSGIHITTNFPFVEALGCLRFGFSGYKEFEKIFSAAAVCPLVLLIPFAFLCKRQIQTKGKRFVPIVVLLIVIPIFLAGFSGATAGMLQRYMMDFYWMILIAGLISAFLIYEWLADKKAQKPFYIGFLGCTLISFVMMTALSCGEPQTDVSWFQYNNPILFEKINYALSFWL